MFCFWLRLKNSSHHELEWNSQGSNLGQNGGEMLKTVLFSLRENNSRSDEESSGAAACQPLSRQQTAFQCRGKNRGGDVMVLVCGPLSATFEPPF